MKIAAVGCFALGVVVAAPMMSAKVMAANLVAKAMPVKAPIGCPGQLDRHLCRRTNRRRRGQRFANPVASDSSATTPLRGGFALTGD
jgi:hypothetical protein